MKTEELFIPFFCNNCQQLAFIYKQSSEQALQVIEFYKNAWNPHLCFNAKGDSIWSHDPSLAKLEWGVQRIPVNFPSKPKKKRHDEPSLGVVIELPQQEDSEESPSFLKVLTMQGSVAYVRRTRKADLTSAGILIDFSQAKKIGNDKYRVSEFIQIHPQLEPDESDNQADVFCFTLSARDQEQLESFVDRFLQNLSKNNLYLQYIIPLEIKPDRSDTPYQRKLAVSSAYKLKKAIETFTFPESIQISVD